jgi:hypothetical protein
MALEVLYVTAYFELVSKYYSTLCGRVETIYQLKHSIFLVLCISSRNYWTLDSA